MRLSTSSDDRPPWLVSFCSISTLITTLLAQSFINTFCTSGNIAYRSRKAGGPLSRGTRHILWLNQPLPSHALLPDIHFSPHSIIIKVTSLFQWPPQRISSLGLLAVARWYVSSLDRFALPPPQSALTTPWATNRYGGYGLRFSCIRCLPQVWTRFIISGRFRSASRLPVVVTVSLETRFRMGIPNVLLTVLGMFWIASARG